MPDYKKMYFKLAAKTADMIEVLEKTTKLKYDLIVAQRECEEIYVESEKPEIIEINSPCKDE